MFAYGKRINIRVRGGISGINGSTPTRVSDMLCSILHGGSRKGTGLSGHVNIDMGVESHLA